MTDAMRKALKDRNNALRAHDKALITRNNAIRAFEDALRACYDTEKALKTLLQKRKRI